MDAATCDPERMILEGINEAECYEAVFNARFGPGFPCNSCGRATKWFRLRGKKAYSCQYCGNHLHPTAGTFIEGSKLPLRYWLLAIYLQKVQGNGVSAADLKSRLPISYITARRVSRIVKSHVSLGSRYNCESELFIPSLLSEITKPPKQSIVYMEMPDIRMGAQSFVGVPFFWDAQAVNELMRNMISLI